MIKKKKNKVLELKKQVKEAESLIERLREANRDLQHKIDRMELEERESLERAQFIRRTKEDAAQSEIQRLMEIVRWSLNSDTAYDPFNNLEREEKSHITGRAGCC